MSSEYQQLPLWGEGRRCTRCDRVQPLTEFHRQASLPGGLKRYCKSCCKQINAEHHQRRRDERNADMREYYRRNADAAKARERERYAADPEPKKRNAADWQSRNPVKKRVYREKWRQGNREKSRNYVRARYARRKGATAVRFTPEQLAAKRAYWGDRCWMCGGPASSWDHVKPLACGGAHCLANLRPACHVCNSRKGDTWPWPTCRRQ